MPPIEQFGMNVPLIGKQPTQEQQQAMHINRVIGEMAASVYTQLVVAEIATRDIHHDLDRDKLATFAQDARDAAVTYFEALGLIQRKQ